MRKFNFKALLLLACGHMAIDCFQGALPAVLPFLKDNLGFSYTMAGVILIVSNISSSVIQPLCGTLADKKDTYILLPLGAFLAGAGFCALPLAPDYLMVLFLAAVTGIGVAAYHPAGFRTARFFTGEKMATGMSIFSVGGNAGMALGPFLALSIIHYRGFSSLWWMFIVALLFVTAILIFRSTVAVPTHESPAAHEAKAGGSQAAQRAFVVLICILILRTWTMYCLMTYIPFYCINYLKDNPLFAGKLVSLFLLGGAAGPLVGSPLADRFGHRFWLRFSLFIHALVFPLILWAHGPLLFPIVILLGFMLISSFPVTVIMGQNLLPQNTGVASGLMSGFSIGTGGIGVTVLGVLADRFGVLAAMKCIWALPIIACVLTIILRYPVTERAKSNLSAA